MERKNAADNGKGKLADWWSYPTVILQTECAANDPSKAWNAALQCTFYEALLSSSPGSALVGCVLVPDDPEEVL